MSASRPTSRRPPTPTKLTPPAAPYPAPSMNQRPALPTWPSLVPANTLTPRDWTGSISTPTTPRGFAPEGTDPVARPGHGHGGFLRERWTGCASQQRGLDGLILVGACSKSAPLQVRLLRSWCPRPYCAATFGAPPPKIAGRYPGCDQRSVEVPWKCGNRGLGSLSYPCHHTQVLQKYPQYRR